MNMEIKKKGNKTSEVHSCKDTSNKGKPDVDSQKSSKNKRKTPNNLQPVTNGKDSVEKKNTSRGLTNNNSSKSSLGVNAVKTKQNNDSERTPKTSERGA